ncbi:MAG: histidine phosphatase family protein [Candidatus Latescibacteria bacterium]|nr:histidine phosphatase family protein [Candidatus Latescibacterota bacterium]
MYTMCLVVRHGETEWNATGRIQGHREVSLNERGQKQAEAVASRLKNEPFDALYSSDLKRTVQTAEAISQRTGHTIHTDPRLREWDLGILAGLTRTNAETQHPKAFAIYNESRVDDPIPEGESIRNRSTRVTACIAEIASNHKGERIVIITHGGPLGDCYRRTTELSFDQPLDVELYNASLNTFVISKSDWTLKTWGDIAHLEGIGSMGNWEGRK